jgi:LPXTG-motif cell wall-anchored protein
LSAGASYRFVDVLDWQQGEFKMRKLLVVSLLVVALAAVMAPTALAWDRAEGCTTDGYGNPWTWGGTVTCRQTFQPFIVVGQGTLDANGCFSVFIGNGHEVDCTIDYNPGPDGDPADDVCTVPTDSSYQPLPWQCSPVDTGTGPNAISLRSLDATSSSAFPMVLGLVGLGALAGGGLFVWRRKQTAA